ncbi:MAG TPA: hypothetical protein PLI05_02570 [Methanotrichaceae archaeon]|nr:hypothetical protein [Methanotrichaceae archaeon]HQF15935.1 hypothetical protein [Methanotrichaceae archaeon]HQI90717.1 hypothetical protein [Methanotrichaceae archaeon]HQJ28004.1 hypothetical protein [Methanotrichaceae archaeon]
MKFETSLALLADVLLLSSLLTPACGITSSFGTESSTGAVCVAGKYDLDRSGSLTDRTSLGQGIASRNLQAGGGGRSSVTDSISGRDRSGQGFSLTKTASVDGSLQTSSSAAATPEGGVLSQNTDLSGDGGLFAIQSASSGNIVAAAAGYSGDGELASSISVAAADRSALSGGAQVMGVDCFDQQAADFLSSGDLGMTVSGLYQSGDELQRFGLSARNAERSGRVSEATYGRITTGTYGYYNEPSAFVIQGYRWTDNPSLKLWVRQDSALTGEGLTAAAAVGSVSAAAETWDGAVAGQSLFNDVVSASTSVNADRYDRNNVHAWKYVASSALGYSRTWYTTASPMTVAGRRYNRALESDVVYNTRWGWTTDKSRASVSRKIYDVQTVATHELGHTLGLGDTYLNSIYKWDLSQIMGFYDAPQRELGVGDKTGIRTIYGN